MTKRTLVSRALALGLAALLAAACGGTTSSGGGGSAASSAPVTITFWDTNAGPDRTPVWQELIRRFEAANPTITVQYVGLPLAEQLQKLHAAVISAPVPPVPNPPANF